MKTKLNAFLFVLPLTLFACAEHDQVFTFNPDEKRVVVGEHNVRVAEMSNGYWAAITIPNSIFENNTHIYAENEILAIEQVTNCSVVTKSVSRSYEGTTTARVEC